ncbi:MAG: hypothetical protein ABJF09_13720 [Qipengyuania citrea]
MIETLAAPENINYVTVWGTLVGLFGLAVALVGLFLTYRQARSARYTSEKLRDEVDSFSLRRDKSEAIHNFSEARSAMEMAGIFVREELWRDASASYDEARRALLRARVVSDQMPRASKQKLRLMNEHLMAFSQKVDNALSGKGEFPEPASVRAAIRRNSDSLSEFQRDLHEELI